MSYIPEPVTRIDKYLAYIAGNMDVALPDHPITRKEHYLAAWAEKSGFEDVDVTGKPPLTLENAIGEPLKGLKLYGKSKQVTTTGAQLLDYDNLMPDMAYGIDGALQSNKGYASSQLIKVTGNSPYTISGLSNIAVIILQYSSEKVLLSRKPSNTNGTYTTLEDTCYIGLTFYANVTVDMLKNAMLNAGSTPLPWEPYTGGLPSPSPDYPQEIESAGSYGKIGIEVQGKNLINADEYYSQFKQSDGTYKAKTVTLNSIKISLSEFVGKKITLSVKLTVGTNTTAVYLIYIGSERNRINGSAVTSGLTGKSTLTVTPVSNTDYFVITYSNGNGDVAFSELQLELGSVTTSYEPYHEPQSMSITTPNGLPGIPVSSGGNYTDTDGQKWVCDEIDFGRGVYVQRIAKEVLNGTERVKWISQIKDVVRFSIETKYHVFRNYDADISQKGLNGFFSHGTYYTNYSLNDIHGYADGDNMYIFLPIIDVLGNDADSIAAYIMEQHENGSPLTMYYIVATPIETTLTADQLAAYKQLHTYKGTTIIDNDAGAYMSVRYEKMK